jgi:membrane protein implicated in regulation of membrane protease activity
LRLFFLLGLLEQLHPYLEPSIYEWFLGGAFLVWHAVIMRWSGFDLATAFWLFLPASLMFDAFLRPTLRRLVPPSLTLGDEAARRLP